MFGVILLKALKKSILANIESKKQTQNLKVQIQDWKGKLEMEKIQMNKPTQVLHARMDNRFQRNLKNYGLTTLCSKCTIGPWGIGIPSGKMVANSLGVHKGVDPREHGVG
jgi:hypothetical protein